MFTIKQNKNNYNQVIVTIIGGFLGALIPNRLSNIPHLLMSVIIGSLLSKTIYGDFDIGYQWSFSDIYYWFITIIEALVGGFLALSFVKKYPNNF
jgi:uncharacterized membrane protein YeaQ/YmgE (transglycosylase-associated protein family)